MGIMSRLKTMKSNNPYLMDYSERDTLEKRQAIIQDLSQYVTSIDKKEWFNVICFGSFLTDNYDETSDIDLLVCSGDIKTLYYIKNEIADYLYHKGLIFDIVESTFKDNNPISLEAMLTYTWAYKNDVPDEMIIWINNMIERWGVEPMEKLHNEYEVNYERFKEGIRASE